MRRLRIGFTIPSALALCKHGRGKIKFLLLLVLSISAKLLKPIDRGELERALKKAVPRLPERSPSQEEATPAEVIASVRNYIDRHYREDIRVEELAERFYFSKEYLARLFRARYGCPPDGQRQGMPDEPRPDRPQIAEKMGYSNANYFGKAFKRRYGVAPSEFRSREEKCAPTPRSTR